MRRAEAAQAIDALEQLVGDAVHDLADLAVHIGMQSAEIRDACRRAHAPEEAVALHEQRGTAAPRRRCCRRNSGGSSTQDDDVVFTDDRRIAGGLLHVYGLILVLQRASLTAVP